MTARTLAGILVVASAAFCYNLGVVLQAAELRDVPRCGAPTPRLFRRLARAPRWLGGGGLSVAGWMLQGWSLTMLPLAVVQPALCLGFVFLVGLSHLILHERVPRAGRPAIGALVGGVVLVSAAGGAPGQPTQSAARFAVALAPLAAFALVPQLSGRLRHDPRWPVLAASAGAAYALTGVSTAALARWLAQGRILLAAGMGTLTLFAAALGLASETHALQLGRVTSVVPLMAAVDTILPVALAPLLFHESPAGGLPSPVVLVAGFLLVGAGVCWLLTSGGFEDVYRGLGVGAPGVRATGCPPPRTPPFVPIGPRRASRPSVTLRSGRCLLCEGRDGRGWARSAATPRPAVPPRNDPRR